MELSEKFVSVTLKNVALFLDNWMQLIECSCHNFLKFLLYICAILLNPLHLFGYSLKIWLYNFLFFLHSIIIAPCIFPWNRVSLLNLNNFVIDISIFSILFFNYTITTVWDATTVAEKLIGLIVVLFAFSKIFWFLICDYSFMIWERTLMFYLIAFGTKVSIIIDAVHLNRFFAMFFSLTTLSSTVTVFSLNFDFCFNFVQKLSPFWVKYHIIMLINAFFVLVVSQVDWIVTFWKYFHIFWISFINICSSYHNLKQKECVRLSFL